MNAFKKARADGAFPQSIGMRDTTDACQMHALRSIDIAHVVTGFVRFDGLDSRLISRSVVDGREMAHILGDVYRCYSGSPELAVHPRRFRFHRRHDAVGYTATRRCGTGSGLGPPGRRPMCISSTDGRHNKGAPGKTSPLTSPVIYVKTDKPHETFVRVRVPLSERHLGSE
jgi:hypothetical protein